MKKTVAPFLAVVLALSPVACIWLPVDKDDFSALPNDPFSNLVRNGGHAKATTTTGWQSGFGMLDPSKLKRQAEEFLLGRNLIDVVELFRVSGGHCTPIEKRQEGKKQACQIDRTWKLRNVGAPTDTKNWPKPAIRMHFTFDVSDSGVVSGLALEATDITNKEGA